MISVHFAAEIAPHGVAEAGPGMYLRVLLADAGDQAQQHDGCVRRADEGLGQQLEMEVALRPGAAVKLLDRYFMG